VVVLLLSLRLGIAIAPAEVPGFAEPSSRPEAEIEPLANSGSRAAPPHQRRGSLHSESLTGDLLGLAGRESLKMASIGHRPLSRGALRRDAAASVPCRAKEHSSSDGSLAPVVHQSVRGTRRLSARTPERGSTQNTLRPAPQAD
jgi:hypothetical protein